MTRADFNRKVRSLLTLAAPGSGATAPEAATAGAMARKLLADYGMTESEIPMRDAAPSRPAAPEQPRNYGGSFTVNINGAGFSFAGFTFDAGTGTTRAW